MLHLRNPKGIFILCHSTGFRASVDRCFLCIFCRLSPSLVNVPWWTYRYQLCPFSDCILLGLRHAPLVSSHTTSSTFPCSSLQHLSMLNPSSSSSTAPEEKDEGEDQSLLGVVWLTGQRLLFSEHIFSSPDFCFSWWKVFCDACCKIFRGR